MYHFISNADFRTLATEILNHGSQLRFRAHGTSMIPFIWDGDILLVEPERTVRRGDVILCCGENEYVLAHRAIRFVTEYGVEAWIVQGDSRQHPDGLVDSHKVLGRVVAVERAGRIIWLGGGIPRLLGMAWASLLPFSRWLYLGLARLKRTVYSM